MMVHHRGLRVPERATQSTRRTKASGPASAKGAHTEATVDLIVARHRRGRIGREEVDIVTTTGECSAERAHGLAGPTMLLRETGDDVDEIHFVKSMTINRAADNSSPTFTLTLTLTFTLTLDLCP
jgi:hypothetical protein